MIDCPPAAASVGAVLEYRIIKDLACLGTNWGKQVLNGDAAPALFTRIMPSARG